MTREIPASRASRFEPLSAAWRFLAAPQTLMVLMGFLALALAVGTLVPQNSPRAVDGSQIWLATQAGSSWQQNGFARALGLSDLFHSPWFHLLLALNGLCLFVRLVESAEFAWRVTGERRWEAAAFAFWGRRPPQARLYSALSLYDVQARIHDFLIQQGFRWADVQASTLPNAVACRRGLVLWAQPVAYGALLLALTGLAIVGTWSWQIEGWQPAHGESWVVGHGTPYVVRLDAFRLQRTGDGRLGDFRSEITWLVDEVAIGQSVVDIGRPATLRGIAVRQVGFAPVVKARAWDNDDQPLTLQAAGEELTIPGELEVVFPDSGAQPLILIPSQDQLLALIFEPQCADGGPALYVTLLRHGGAESQLLGTLHESGSLQADELRVAIDLTYRPILRIDYLPAMGLVVGGMALVVLALAIIWIVPPRLAWVAIEPAAEDSTLVRILVPAGARGRRWLLRQADQLGEVLAGDD